MELGNQQIQGKDDGGLLRWPDMQEEWALKEVGGHSRLGCENSLMTESVMNSKAQ